MDSGTTIFSSQKSEIGVTLLVRVYGMGQRSLHSLSSSLRKRKGNLGRLSWLRGLSSYLPR